MTPEERVTQLHEECVRLVNRNAELEGLLSTERVWRSNVTRALAPLLDLLAVPHG